MAVLVRMTHRFFARNKEPYSAMEFCAFGL
jgi:hypothetical protein